MSTAPWARALSGVRALPFVLPLAAGACLAQAGIDFTRAFTSLSRVEPGAIDSEGMAQALRAGSGRNWIGSRGPGAPASR